MPSASGTYAAYLSLVWLKACNLLNNTLFLGIQTYSSDDWRATCIGALRCIMHHSFCLQEHVCNKYVYANNGCFFIIISFGSGSNRMETNT